MSNSFPNPLSCEEEAYYINQLEDEDSGAKEVLIERNLRLVAHIARKYMSTGFELDDLISIGTLGLIKAVNTYTGSRSTRLATYAAKCIENEILMSIRSAKRTKNEVILSLPIGVDKDGNEINISDILGTDGEEVVETIHLNMQVEKLYEAIGQVLNPREKQVIVGRYGLNGGEPRPQREIAKELGISRSYVSRIEKRALEKLREVFVEEIETEKHRS